MHDFYGAAAAFIGAVGVILGAFGAHLLKKYLDESQLASFETGVRYQLMHALLLFIVHVSCGTPDVYIIWAERLLFIGIFFFSFSIYGLVLTGMTKQKWKWLGPITPLGGLLLIIGWLLIGIHFISIG